MIGDAVLSNAMWWGHFRLLGGPGKIAIRTSLYIGFVVAAFTLFCRIRFGAPVAANAGSAVYVVGILQLAMILIMCSGRLNKAVVDDVNSKMIESHRLSPMTGVSAVIGYMIGPNLQVLLLTAVNFVVGLIFCSLAGKWQVSWMAAHLYLAFVATFVWSAAVLAALVIGKKINVMIILILLSVFGGFRMVPLIPALGLLFGSEMIGYCYDTITFGAAKGIPPGAGLTVVVQILVILSCIRAAAHKFERPDLPAFSEFWALVSYVGWILIAIIALGRTTALHLPFLGNILPPNVHLIGTLIVSVLLLILPLRSSSILSQRWNLQHRELRGRKPIGPMRIAVCLSVLLGGLLIGLVTRNEWMAFFQKPQSTAPIIFSQWAWTAGCILCTALSLGALYRAACALRSRSIDILPVAFLFLTWAVFPLLDASREAYQSATVPDHVSAITFLTACSPAGGIFLVWSAFKPEYWIALGVQGLCCLAAIGVYVLAMRRSRAKLREARTGR